MAIEKARGDTKVIGIDEQEILLKDVLDVAIFGNPESLAMKRALVSETPDMMVERRVWKWGQDAKGKVTMPTVAMYDLKVPLTYKGMETEYGLDVILSYFVKSLRVESDRENSGMEKGGTTAQEKAVGKKLGKVPQAIVEILTKMAEGLDVSKEETGLLNSWKTEAKRARETEEKKVAQIEALKGHGLGNTH